MVLGEGCDLVEKGIGIPHRAVTFTRYPEEGVIIGLDSHFRRGFPETSLDRFEGYQLEMKLLTAGADCGRNLLQFGGCEDEYDILRRFLYGLEKCVEGTGAQHVNLIDDVYFIPR